MAQELPILIKGGTEAARAASAQGTREPHFTTDAKRFYVGDQIIGWPFVEGELLSGDLSGTGTTNLVLANGYGVHLCLATLGVGPGAYNRKLVLPGLESGGQGLRSGTIWELQVVFPASTNPTLEVRNEAAGGTLLWSFNPPDVSAPKFTLTFVRLGGAWVLWKTNQPLVS